MKRPYGSGSVDPKRGKFVARVRTPDGRRPVIGVFSTDTEAHIALDAYYAALAQAGVPSGTMTLRTWGMRYLDRRESSGTRNIATDRSRWKCHIATAHFADWPLINIEKSDIKSWLELLGKKQAADVRATTARGKAAAASKVYLRKERKVSPQLRKHCLNLLRKALDEAVEDKLIATNPASGVKAPRVTPAEFDYLRPLEQNAIEHCDRISEAERLRAMFAWGTGMRQFDQWSMKIVDVRGLDTANPDVYFWCHKLERRVRIPLFGPALRAVNRWLKLLPAYCETNELGLLWPLPSGCRRAKSKQYGWAEMKRLAGIRRNVKWHELRDTCASSLLNGWWGRSWSLEEVKDMLVHSSIEVTERYAHLSPDTLSRAAAETDQQTIGHQLATTATGQASKNPTNQGRATQNSNLRPSASEADALSN